MAYQVLTFKESVRIPPNLFGLKLDKAALTILRDRFERTVNKDYGILVSLHNAQVTSEGRVLPGDGAAYFDVEFDALSYVPKVNEVI
ncbi:MAG: RPB7/RPC8 family DNA-directed RNA polymerase subunit, partial [Candidatus Micrarchaeota archaeon]|nr:RPB7/RPC8 family DNA-directed RNA polymerase subunit [Candidatus Micrarchaeota archaeon]